MLLMVNPEASQLYLPSILHPAALDATGYQLWIAALFSSHLLNFCIIMLRKLGFLFFYPIFPFNILKGKKTPTASPG